MSNRNSKGQVTQTFTFLSAAIIIGVLLLFGGYSVVKLIDNVEQIEDLQFRTQLEERINSVSSKYGSVEIVKLRNLNSFDTMCVFDLAEFNPETSSISVLGEYPLIRGALIDKSSNIFLIHSEGIESFLNDQIAIDSAGYYDCHNISISGTIDIRLEGLGKKAQLQMLNGTG